MRKVTVFEVAAEARVSLATVDRVLNGRPGVRPTTVGRVQAAVQKLGFRRDAFAAGLATRRLERFAFVVPARGTNSFMNGLREAVVAAGQDMTDQRVAIRLIDYTAFDEAALCATLGGIERASCEGVAVVALDSPAVRHEIDRLVARGIPVVTLVSDVSPSRRLGYLGIDNKAAGRVAGSLIGRMAGRSTGKVGVIVGQMTLHDHADRRLGFEQVMRREFPGLALLPTLEARDDSALAERLANRLLDEHPDLAGLYSAGAGNQGIIGALRRHDRNAGGTSRPIVVAHELTAYTRDALLSDTVTAILHQDQEQEVAGALTALRAASRGGDAGTKPLRTQIFLRDNVP